MGDARIAGRGSLQRGGAHAVTRRGGREGGCPSGRPALARLSHIDKPIKREARYNLYAR